MTPFTIGKHTIEPGTRSTDRPAGECALEPHADDTSGACPSCDKPGPAMFISGCVHAMRSRRRNHPRILVHPALGTSDRHTSGGADRQQLRLSQSAPRYMPDRRDLNRSFLALTVDRWPACWPTCSSARWFCAASSASTCILPALHRPTCHKWRIAPGGCAETAEAGAGLRAPVILISKLREKSLRLSRGTSGVKVLLLRGWPRRCGLTSSHRCGCEGSLPRDGCRRDDARTGRASQISADLAVHRQQLGAGAGRAAFFTPSGVLVTVFGQKGSDRCRRRSLGVQATPVVSEDDGVIRRRTNSAHRQPRRRIVPHRPIQPVTGAKSRTKPEFCRRNSNDETKSSEALPQRRVRLPRIPRTSALVMDLVTVDPSVRPTLDAAARAPRANLNSATDGSSRMLASSVGRTLGSTVTRSITNALVRGISRSLTRRLRQSLR